MADSSIAARFVSALIDVSLAKRSLPALYTDARERIQWNDRKAGATFPTRPEHSNNTTTANFVHPSVRTVSRIGTNPTVLTRVCSTLINICITNLPRPTCCTDAAVGIYIDTDVIR